MKLVILSIIVITLLFFGCIDLGGGQKSNDTATNTGIQGNNTKPKNTSIILDDQQNTSIATNTTTQQQNNTPPKIGMDYSTDLNASLAVYFINVGKTGVNDEASVQGEAIYIKKGDVDILIDTGSGVIGGTVADYVKNRNADDLELLISTSVDERRYGGIQTVLDKIKIEEFWWSGYDLDNQSYKKVVKNVQDKVSVVNTVGKGFTKTINGIKFEVLNPKTPPFVDQNNDAIVLRIEDRNFTMLFTSNIQTGARDKLLNEQLDKLTNATVMTAPYYGLGSGTSNIQLFLTKTKPNEIAFIKNSNIKRIDIEKSNHFDVSLSLS